MLAIHYTEFEKYGCPNCGCDRFINDQCVISNQPGGTCKSCNLHYQILADSLTVSNMSFYTGRRDDNGKEILEHAILIPHPRKGIRAWHYVTPDIRPEYGEYWTPRGIGYDLSGFVKSKPAGERLLEMVKEVLEKEKPHSWLDYREHEPEWIQFKMQKDEFDLEKLETMVTQNHFIITKEILEECNLTKEKE